MTKSARLGILNLEIVLGRYESISCEEFFCTLCDSGLVEDEMHFVLVCNYFINKSNLLFQDKAPDNTKSWLKGLSVIVNSKLHFFTNPQIFMHFQREITYLYNNSHGKSIFLERETILCCLELIVAGDN